MVADIGGRCGYQQQAVAAVDDRQWRQTTANSGRQGGWRRQTVADRGGRYSRRRQLVAANDGNW